ncbi:hypothetical protein [Streptomyces sp. 3211]
MRHAVTHDVQACWFRVDVPRSPGQSPRSARCSPTAAAGSTVA